MMTYIQYLLGKVAEEANEVAQRALKAQQFGIEEVQDGQPDDSWSRLNGELLDLQTVLRMLEEAAGRGFHELGSSIEQIKRAKVRQYLQLSIDRGHVEPMGPRRV